MSTPIKVTLTSTELLKVKSKLWQKITSCLGKMGVLVPELKPIQAIKESIKRSAKCEPVPINKVGDYYEGEDGNTTLSMEFNDANLG